VIALSSLFSVASKKLLDEIFNVLEVEVYGYIFLIYLA